MAISPKTTLTNCQHLLCEEFALSFSKHCWTHLEFKADYTKQVEGFLKTADERSVCLNLRKAQLQDLNFSRLNLSGSCFNQAHLKHCEAIGCELSKSDMIGARLESCHFVGCALNGVNFTKAILRDCSFSYSDIRHASLTESTLHDVDFMGAHLYGVSLWGAEFNNVKHLKRKSFQDPQKPSKETQAAISESNHLMACDSYRMLKHYLNNSGLYEDASWAAYRELTMERKYFFEKKDSRYLPSLLMDLLSGYAAKPNRVIVSSLVIILFLL